MIRVYFWFLGVPKDRLGGPWWYKDLISLIEADEFLADARASLFAYAVCLEPFEEHQPMEIYPPATTQIMARKYNDFYPLEG